MGYKVVRIENGKFFSVAVRHRDDRIEYKMNKWVEANPRMGNYKLTYFKYFKDAKNFVYPDNYQTNIKVYKCKVRGSVKTKNLPACCQIMQDGSICVDIHQEWPDKTYMAEKIMLVEEIKI